MRQREYTDEHRAIVRRCRMRLGETLYRLRKDLRLSQEEASHRAGLDNKTVGRIERGEVTPTFETLMLLGNVYGQGASEFLREIAAGLDGIVVEKPQRRVGTMVIKDAHLRVEVWKVGS